MPKSEQKSSLPTCGPSVRCGAESKSGCQADAASGRRGQGANGGSQETNHLQTGDVADAVFPIQENEGRFAVVSKIGEEAALGTLSTGKFFGEGWITKIPGGIVTRGEQF